MENRMSIFNTNRNSDEESSPLISERDIPASVYQAQDAHWSVHYAARPYVKEGEDYEDYAPAYLYGVFLYHSNPAQHFDARDAEAAKGWDSARGNSPLDWPKAQPAVREAWYRISNLAERAEAERNAALSTSPRTPTAGDQP
jgi:hypothetical protein